MASPTKHGDKWRIRWTDENRQRRSEVYSTPDDAAFALRRHQLEVEEVRRGLRRPATARRRFTDLCDLWLTNRATQKRAGDTDTSIIETHLRPAFGELAIDRVTPDAVDRYRADRAHLKPKTIHNQLTLLISMLRYAVDVGWLVRAPRIRKPVVRLDEKDFRHLRTDDEIKRFLDAAAVQSEWHLVFYSTAVYSGLRAGELATLQWSDVDLEKRLITVQRGRNGLTKGGRVRYVPILDVLLQTLERWHLRTGGVGLVFPNTDGLTLDRSGPHYKVARVLRRAGLPGDYICFHSLRHTFATMWVRHGGDLFKLQKVLGHSTIALTQRYAHLAPDAYRTDWARFGAAPQFDGATVLPMRSARAPTAAASNA